MSTTEHTTQHPYEDRALKEAARLFGEELLPLLGVREKIVRIAPTEQVFLKPQDFTQDFNYEMADGSWIHLEFESDSITIADLRRFRTYEAIMSQHYEVPVVTYVLCSSNVKKLKSELTEGINTYHVKILRLKDQNADQFLSHLEQLQETQTALKRSDLLQVLLTPLMNGKTSQMERITKGMSLLRQERGHLSLEEQAQMEAVLYTLAQKFLTDTQLIQLKEMMNMTFLGELIMQDGIEKGRKEGIEEGIEKVTRLNQILLDTDRLNDLKRSTIDPDFQNQLLEELVSDK